jgi:hypothetical protein
MLDFGEGFYTTTDYEQAKRWAERVNLLMRNTIPGLPGE